MDRFYKGLDAALTGVLIALTVAMVVSITTEIVLNAVVQPATGFLLNRAGEESSSYSQLLKGVMNFIANASSPVNTASQTLLVWVGILGSALAFRYRAHLGVDAVVRLYPPKARLYLDYASTVVVGLFSLLVFIIGGYQVCYRSFLLGSKMPGFESFNRGWFYLVLIITGALNLLYCFYHLLHPKPVGGVEEGKEPSNS